MTEDLITSLLFVPHCLLKFHFHLISYKRLSGKMKGSLHPLQFDFTSGFRDGFEGVAVGIFAHVCTCSHCHRLLFEHFSGNRSRLSRVDVKMTGLVGLIRSPLTLMEPLYFTLS